MTDAIKDTTGTRYKDTTSTLLQHDTLSPNIMF